MVVFTFSSLGFTAEIGAKGSAAPPSGIGAETAGETKSILEKARQHLDSKKNRAHVVMKIIDGAETKVRELDLSIMQTENGSKALVRMTAPADSKGTAMLAVVDKGEQQQWLYLPSSKQVRRIASVNKSSGLLGSELSPEDLNPDALKDADVKLVKKDDKIALIRLTPKPGTSDYAYAETSFSLADGLPQRTEYFKGDTLQKTIEFQDYKVFEGKISRAQKIHIVNPIKNRGTDIELSDIKVNAKLSDRDFTPEALKANW